MRLEGFISLMSCVLLVVFIVHGLKDLHSNLRRGMVVPVPSSSQH